MLPSHALGAGLRETRGDDQQRAYAGGRALSGDADDLLGGDRDDGHLDCALDLSDRAIRGQRLDDLGVVVHRVDGTGELGGQEVVQISPPIVPRRRDAPITASERGSRKLRTAATAATRSRFRIARSRPATVTLAARFKRVRNRPELYRESACTEHIDHPVVLRQHLRDERGDPVLVGHLGHGPKHRPGRASAREPQGLCERRQLSAYTAMMSSVDSTPSG